MAARQLKWLWWFLAISWPACHDGVVGGKARPNGDPRAGDAPFWGDTPGDPEPSGPPPAPTGVMAVSGNEQVILRWDASPGAESYRVYWDLTAGVTIAAAHLEASTPSQTHTGLTNGTTYYYVVTALNSRGESPPSSEVTATPDIYTLASNWYMTAANPQRTSWVTEPVTTGQVEWYRPIEAYIDQKVQIIAVDGLLYISTARGLLALVAETGDLVWRFDTELPLGNAPTVDRNTGVLYVAGYDQMLHALNAATGAPLWSFAGAEAGYNTNPLVVDGLVILGNRDGTLYAVGAHGTTNQGQLVWSYPTAGPIHLSAAYKDGVVFFASNDNHAYAIRSADGSLVWRSALLWGDGFHSFWPVIYRDQVIFSGPKGMASISGVFEVTSPWPPDMEGTLVGDVLDPQDWSNGFPVARAFRMTEYTEDNPDGDPFQHKPWHRIYFVLGRDTGTELTFDSDQDTFPEYLPFGPWAKTSGNHYPPVVDLSDNLLYGGSVYSCCSDAKGKVYGWTPDHPDLLSYVGAPIQGDRPRQSGGWAAMAEPQALSGAGSGSTEVIYRSLCCDRVGDWFATHAPEQSGQFWSYNLGSQIPGYDFLWYIGDNAISRHIGWYTGTLDPPSMSGQYGAHGDPAPIVPHRGRVFAHRSNVVIAYGPGTPRGQLPMLPIQPATDSVPVPSDQELKTRLEKAIQAMLDVGNHLRPGWSTTSLNNYREFQDYFVNPGETLLTWCMAYPHLSSTTRAAVRDYLQNNFWPEYFDPVMYARMGWTEGIPREAPPLYPETVEDIATQTKSENASPYFSWTYPPQNFYALYVCAKNIAELDEVELYQAAKSKLRVPANVANETETFTDDPFEHNGWLTGYIGFLALQELANMSVTDADLRNQVIAERDRLLALRWTLFTKDSPWQDRGITYKKSLDLSRNFFYLCPELGQYYRDNILLAVEEALTEYEQIAPFWFVGRYEAFYGENVLQPLYNLPAMFQAKAWILQDNRTELYKHLDAPSWLVGDLFYIQNLVATIEAP